MDYEEPSWDYEEPSGDEYTPDGKFVYGSATNDDNSYQFCLITDQDQAGDCQYWYEVPDKVYSLAVYDVEQQSLVDSVDYRPLEKYDHSQGWHCISCVGNKSETTVVLSQLFDLMVFRFVNGKLQKAEILCDQRISVDYDDNPIRRVKICKGKEDEDFQVQVTKMITLSESEVSIFTVRIA